jgi:hypothetical protein
LGKENEMPETLCRICLGTIKEGRFRITCSCRNDFHETCASKLIECPICNNPLQNVQR